MEKNTKKPLPESIASLIKQLKAMSEEGKINFAFAFTYPDDKGQYWFEAHTGGTARILKSLFEDDTNAEAVAKLNLVKEKEDEFIYFSTPPSPLTPIT